MKMTARPGVGDQRGDASGIDLPVSEILNDRQDERTMLRAIDYRSPARIGWRSTTS